MEQQEELHCWKSILEECLVRLATPYLGSTCSNIAAWIRAAPQTVAQQMPESPLSGAGMKRRVTRL
jgi:hypothetical protein